MLTASIIIGVISVVLVFLSGVLQVSSTMRANICVASVIVAAIAIFVAAFGNQDNMLLLFCCGVISYFGAFYIGSLISRNKKRIFP